jgi:hypothetical protein
MTEARRLDPTQRAAAAADAPVQLTLAGPGAGKTTTLAVRFVHLVRQGVDPRRILAVTFTRKAAIEMQDRIVRLLRLARRDWRSTPFTPSPSGTCGASPNASVSRNSSICGMCRSNGMCFTLAGCGGTRRSTSST